MALSNEVFNNTKQYLREVEDLSEEAYKDGKGNSIGYGHSGPDVKTGDTITEEQAERLLDKDLKEKYALAKRLMPKFDTFPAPVQQQVLSSVYRGSLSGSPKTIKLINDGKFSEAAEEFLDNNEYRKSVEEETGVAPRMRAVASALQSVEQNQGGSTANEVLVGGGGNPPDTLAPTTAGGPRTEASNNITPADAQTEDLFSPDNVPPPNTALGTKEVPTDPNRYYGNNLQRQLRETIPLSKPEQSSLDFKELDAGLSTGTEKQEQSTEAARLKRIKDMNYSRDELFERQGELGLTDEQLDEFAFEDMSVEPNPPEDEPLLGDILQGLFEQGDSVDEVSTQGYEEPSSMAEQNLAEGGPVERQVKFVKNNNDEEEEEKELPDPPPGATPEEVADDVPAMLSTGEYVLPANIVRYIGLERIVGMHKNILFKLQQMADLGIIQNVDHNGDPEDDNTEMDFIQEPEVTSEKKLMVIIKPKGMMNPAHFSAGGGASMADQILSD
tara:strand:+ start:2423 stop:3919 length:1497 start_codon:yes stop_codon:yes gene_type:complete